MRQFTAQEIEDAKFFTNLAIRIRQNARMFEVPRKRNLSALDVLSRVSVEDKERYERGMALYEAGAYRP